MPEIRLFAVPYELGGLRVGVGRGPERLLEAGAERALAQHGAEVRTEFVELGEDRRDQSGDSEANAGFDLIRQVANRVSSALDDGAFPVLLSGSCFNGVGMVAGLRDASRGVVWFDAHGDFNTPETAVDGYLDGMGLAIMTGGAWQGLNSEGPDAPVPETAVVLVGARSFDPPEEARLKKSKVRHLRTEEIDSDDAVVRAVGTMNPAPAGVYLHLDLDVLDVDEAPVNIYSVGGGLSAAQLEAQVRSVLEQSPVRAFSLTAYDPECDPEARVLPIAMRLLEIVGERVAKGPSRDLVS